MAKTDIKSKLDPEASDNKSRATGDSTKTAVPKQETDTHAASPGDKKFYGPTEGNADRSVDLSDGDGGGKGESHPYKASQGPFIGDTKGNKDRPVDISRGTGGKDGGKYVAGRGNKVFSGNKGGF
jgi:hypothetical protein